MTPALLITQCLQTDFVKPIGRNDPLPNRLHIGHDESRRLMGDRPEEGPVVQTVKWAYDQGPDRIRLIHVRDWHDRQTPGQTAHLERFGAHCLKDTPGADFVFGPPPPDRADVHIIDSLTLNDFQDTVLAEVLAPWADQPMRVGLMGVWTEAKITYLAYELTTRYPRFEIAVCAALTASSSRTHHFMALDQLTRLLGVKVFPAVGSFLQFLGGRADNLPLARLTSGEIPVVTGAPDLSEDDRTLAKYLFRDCRRVQFRVLDGGYSGNVVLGSESEDLFGHRQVPHVLKIGPQSAIGRERTSFERVESVLGNNAPRIADFADLGDRGAIKYRYASMGGGTSKTFQSLYKRGLPARSVDRILHQVFVEQLGRFSRTAELERVNLLAYYEYNLPDLGPRIRRRVEDVYGKPARGDSLVFPGGRAVNNLCAFYEDVIPQILPKADGTSYLCNVHGDLNGANILVDEQENVWLIDFFHMHRGHALKDLIKLENDLLYIFTPVTNDRALGEAMAFSEHLMGVEDLAKPLKPLPADIRNADFRRAFRTIRTLRSFYGPVVHLQRDPLQLWIAQLRYAAHALSFGESSPRQKRWALYTGSLCAERIAAAFRQLEALRVDWIDDRQTEPGRLGVTVLPGRKDRGRLLSKDLRALTEQQVNAVVCLVPDTELKHYGVPKLLDAYKRAGLDVHHLPVLDQKNSTLEEMERLVDWVHERLARGRRVVIHCVGGLGRSGVAAACVLRRYGLTAAEAIAEVRRVRSQRAVETTAQEEFVGRFRA